MEKKLLHERSAISKSGHSYSIRFWAGEVAEISIVDWPSNALETLIRGTRGYAGVYTDTPVSEEDKVKFLHDIQNTKLGTPLEFLNFVFLVRDVPRSFTHQIVRTRIGAAYVQESTRFIGAKDVYDIVVPKTAVGDYYGIEKNYVLGTVAAISHYEDMLTVDGVASQDARNLLPHNVLTHLFWSINMKSLQTVYNQRFCCQAELSSWVPVVRGAKRLIAEKCGNEIASLLSAPVDRMQPCGFNASFDRPCAWRNGVNYNAPVIVE